MRREITGRVLYGDRLGKRLGYPTANLDRRDYCRRKLKIKFGIWAGKVIIIPKKNPKSDIRNPKSYKAGIVIGPLDKKHLPKIEAHLIGFRGDLYGKRLTFKLKKYMRPFRRFYSVERLKRQIEYDIKKIKLMHL